MLCDYIIQWPHVDLCSETLSSPPESQSKSRLSQLIMGEAVTVVRRSPTHLFVKVPSQSFFCRKSLRWQGYPGWILSESVTERKQDYIPNYVVISHNALLYPQKLLLPFGCKIVADMDGNIRLPNEQIGFCDPCHLRLLKRDTLCLKTLLQDAQSFHNLPYLWGGRSTLHQENIWGVDCSGFIHLLYGAQGFSIPRDAKDQFLSCRIYPSFQKLPVGGLLFFLERDDKERISHVLLKTSSTSISEATMSANKVIINHKDVEFKITSKNLLMKRVDERKTSILFGSLLLISQT